MSDASVVSIPGLIFPRPLRQSRIVCAHRGFSACYPENTMASFRAAASAGADMIELDVRFTKDGLPVVSHDGRVNRCTNGKGKISDYTLRELQKLDAGSWFHPDFSKEYIPTLGEVLRFCKNKMAVNIEIKALNSSGAAGVMNVISQTGMQPHVIVSSFDTSILSQFREYDSDVLLALLYDRRGSDGQEVVGWVEKLHLNAVHAYHWIMRNHLLEKICDHEIPFQIYTVNRVSAMKRFLQRGAVGIITNYPDRLVTVLGDEL